MGSEPLPPHTTQSPARIHPPAPAVVATSLARGFRFHPTDQELVSYYLKRKVCGKPLRYDAIAETDIYKSDPWDLPALSRLKSRDNEWYFFGVQDRKYVNGSRVNRATANGYWKATGNDRPIILNTRTVGMKKTLVFYCGRAPSGRRTNWVMHEYRLTEEGLNREGIVVDSYLLCKILKKNGPGFKPGEQYGPYVEEEWEREDATFIPGGEVDDDAVTNDDPHEDSPPAETPEPHPSSNGVLPKEEQPLPPFCKLEPPDDCPLAGTPDSELLTLGPNKRVRQDLEAKGSPNKRAAFEFDAFPANGSSRSPPLTTNSSSSLLEFPLLDPVDSKEGEPVPLGMIDINMPPSYLKLFEELRSEIYKLSIEKESLKIEFINARTMINILQTKVDQLSRENDDVRRRHEQFSRENEELKGNNSLLSRENEELRRKSNNLTTEIEELKRKNHKELTS